MNAPVKAKIHFPNLDGLRFVGSFIILVLHIEELKVSSGKEPLLWVKQYLPIGGLDVSLFFVLSGFLIGYLLLKEKADTGNIDMKKYYTRRCLRIWPLYFFIILLGFFVFPYLGELWGIQELKLESPYKYIDFILCMLFLPPYDLRMRAIGAAWSLRVEEVFYVFEPLILKRTKKYITVFLVIVLGVILFRNGYFFMCRIFHLSPWFRHFQKIITFYRLSCMAIGGIGASLVISDKKNILPFLFRKDVQWVVYLVTLALIVANIRIPYIEFEFYSVLFCFIIINLAANPKSIVRLDYGWMNYLGKISYGMYLYGAVFRILCLYLTEKIFGHDLSGVFMNVVFYLLTISFTIVISIISFHFFETPFLKLKNRFEVIKTQA
ncbi:MAG TPA: acyltransferase [Bacteroidia bacterium]|jgi:peptidoglycan/LPS O-acetylase OafA/YrhL|nr:acyltransferase [Bacteroidia bacterium]